MKNIKLIFLGLILGASAWLMLHVTGVQVDGAAQEVAIAKAKLASTEKQVAVLRRGLSETEVHRQAMQARVVKLEAALKAKPLPPSPPPTPATLPDLQQTLVGFGLSNRLMVVEDGDSVIIKPDGLLIHTWGAQAMRIPAMEEHITASASLIAGLKEESHALTQESEACKSVVKAQDVRHESARQNIDALTKSLSTNRRKSTIEKIVWGFGGVAIGYLVKR